MSHVAECKWQQTPATECAYRQTHHYCPHQEHACTCPPKLPTVPHELGHTLLMQYSEWLDEQRIDMFGPQHDGRTHSDLVDAFLAQRNPRAIPQLEK